MTTNDYDYNAHARGGRGVDVRYGQYATQYQDDPYYASHGEYYSTHDDYYSQQYLDKYGYIPGHGHGSNTYGRRANRSNCGSLFESCIETEAMPPMSVR